MGRELSECEVCGGWRGRSGKDLVGRSERELYGLGWNVIRMRAEIRGDGEDAVRRRML